MTKEELLIPRYLCESPTDSHYPYSPFKVGDILTLNQISGNGSNCCTINGVVYSEAALNKYPHLFRRLEWWEFRDEKDMPEYVRYGDWRQPHTIYRIVQYNPKGYNGLYPCAIAENNRVKDYFLPHFNNSFPATKEEYDNQKQ